MRQQKDYLVIFIQSPKANNFLRTHMFTKQRAALKKKHEEALRNPFPDALLYYTDAAWNDEKIENPFDRPRARAQLRAHHRQHDSPKRSDRSKL